MVFLTPVTFDPSYMWIPSSMADWRTTSLTSLSRPDKILGKNSTTLTSLPKALNMKAISMPMIPPPIITRDFGTSSTSRISLLVMISQRSPPGTGNLTGTAPVAMISFLYLMVPSIFFVLTPMVSSSFTKASPLITLMLCRSVRP